MGQGKGGGPKTAAGKARSSRNAVRHGVTALADPMVLPTESEEEWLAFRDSIVADIGPTGAVQEEIARYVAECMWTRRRLRVMENASVQGEMRAWLGHLRVLRTMDHTENPKDITPDHKARYEEQKGRWMRKSVIPDESDLAKIIKYDSHLTRQINRALWELRLLKREQEGREPGSAWLEVRGGNVDRELDDEPDSRGKRLRERMMQGARHRTAAVGDYDAVAGDGISHRSSGFGYTERDDFSGQCG